MGGTQKKKQASGKTDACGEIDKILRIQINPHGGADGIVFFVTIVTA